MVLDAILAYLHFIAIFILFALLCVQAVLVMVELHLAAAIPVFAVLMSRGLG